ncbi:SRPBCC domain-containing protein [Streptomyces sp. DT171]|uniref:SRPBCC domain-containing protein n=1 Tax=Streptomyces sp. DT171 TaxID=3416524 RepID=UPI003CF501A3
MEHETFVPVPARSLRETLGDPARVARCVPGLQQDADASTGTPAARFKVRVGGHTITYRGAWSTAPEGTDTFSVTGEGVEARGTGSAKLALTIRLTETDGGTTIAYMGTASGDGRFGELSPGAALATAHRLLDRFTQQLVTESLAAQGESPGEEGSDGEGPDGKGPGGKGPGGERPGEATAEAGGVPGAVGEAVGPADPASPGYLAAADDSSARGSGAGGSGADGSAADGSRSDGSGGGGESGGSDESGGGGGRGESGADRSEGAAGGGSSAVADGPGGIDTPGGPAADAGVEPEELAELLDEFTVDDIGEMPSAAPGSVADDAVLPEMPSDNGSSMFEAVAEPPSLDPMADDVMGEVEFPIDDEPPAEAAHARRTMIGRSAEEVDHAPPRGRYAPLPPPESSTAGIALRWVVPAAALALASAVVVSRVLRRHR